MAPQKSPPPTTVVPKTFLKNSTTDDAVIQVAYEVRGDSKSSDSNLEGSALTDFETEGGITDELGNRVLDADNKQSSVSFPSYDLGFQKGTKVVTALRGKFQMIFTYVIQTQYGPKASASQPSAYGRGTTTADEAAGDTSLGFHESCHRADLLEYLQKQPLPTYRGKVGMKEAEFNGANRSFAREFAEYFVKMRKFSDDRTDEVGYKWSEYKKNGPRKT
jgi:hypothetical protein